MATENNYQITSFTKGMNTDSSYTLIDDGSYTMAKNIRTNSTNATNNTNSQNAYGEVKPIEGLLVGTEISYYIPISGATLENFDDNTKWQSTTKYSTIKSILATGTIRQYGIIIFEYDVQQQDRGNWAVAVFKNKIGETEDYKTDGGDQEDIPNKLYVIFDAKQTVTEGIQKFSIVTRYENDESIKVYIADTKDPLILLNIANPYLMYQLDVTNVKAYPDIQFIAPEIMGLIGGDLKPGTVQYAYQLYNKYGVSTDISPLSKRFPIVSNVDTNLAEQYVTFTYGTNPVNFEKQVQNIKGEVGSWATNRGVLLTINIDENSLPKNLDRIYIYRIHYLQAGQVPQISLIFDEKLSYFKVTDQPSQFGNNYYRIEDTRQNGILKTVSVEEFNSMQGVHVIPKQIESKFDYMFASNIKYEQVNATNYYKPKCTITQIDSEIQFIEDYKRFNLQLDPVENVVNSQDGIGRQLYLKSGENKRTYSDPKAFSDYRSFRHGELYRFGVVLYFNDTTSQTYYLDDITINDDINFTEDYGLKTSAVGVNINISKTEIEKLIPEGKTLIGYEIVRCLKDFNHLKTISQGVLSRPIKRYGAHSNDDDTNIYDSDPYVSLGFISTNEFRVGHPYQSAYDKNDRWTAGSAHHDYGYWAEATNRWNKKLYQFISPEFSYMEEYMKTAIKGNKFKIKPIKFLKYDTISRKPYSGYFLKQQNVDNWKYTEYDIADLYSQKSTGWSWCADYDRDHGNVYYPNAIQFHNNFILVPYKIKAAAIKDHITGAEEIYSDNETFSLLDPFTFAYHSSCGKTVTVDQHKNSYKKQNIVQKINYSSNTDDQNYKTANNKNYAYFKLYNIDNNATQGITPQSYELQEVECANNINYNGFVIQSTGSSAVATNTWIANYLNFQQAVGSEQYLNSCLGAAYDYRWLTENVGKDLTKLAADDYPFGNAGSCAVICLKNETTDLNVSFKLPYGNNMFDGYDTDENWDSQAVRIGTWLCNLEKQDVDDYGDPKYSTYYSFGDYFKYNNQDINVNIYSGDVITTAFEYVSKHKIYTSKIADDPTQCLVYSIPVETSIALPYVSGYQFSYNMGEEYISTIQQEASNVFGLLTQNEPLYVYNSAYGIEPNARIFAAINPNHSDVEDSFDYRVINSQQKTNGEYQDSFTKFQSANYIDVDTRYGELTNIRAFGNYLFFWQEHAFGTLSVNERSIIQDANSQNIVLGTGDVLARYDYIDRTSGMHKQEYCDTQSPTMLYWFDDDNQEMRAYSGQGGLNILSKSYNVQNLLNRHSNPNVCPTLFHDPRYNEVVANVISFNKEDLSNPMSIVFNEQVKAFTSVYDIDFDGTVQFYNGTYLTKVEDNKIRIGQWDKWNQDKGYPEGWNDRLQTYIEYVVNKSAITAKVFDNQEIVTENVLKPSPLVGKDKDGECSPFANNDYYMTWRTDLNNSEGTPRMTNREGNFRFAIPRADNAKYGSRIRGKYMVVGIENKQPAITDSISYIVTKFRTSWS